MASIRIPPPGSGGALWPPWLDGRRPARTRRSGARDRPGSPPPRQAPSRPRAAASGRCRSRSGRTGAFAAPARPAPGGSGSRARARSGAGGSAVSRDTIPSGTARACSAPPRACDDLAERLQLPLEAAANGLAELEHARLALTQLVEQLDPRRLAQRAKALRDQLDQVSGKRVRNGHPSLLARVGPSSLSDRRPELPAPHPQPR